MPDVPTTANAGQIAYWNADVGVRWASIQDRIDAIFAGFTAATLERAAPRPGEHVLDIGCGCGTTTLALADAVGPAGAVLGVDVSRPMLDLAARRVADRKVGNVTLVQSDAASHAFDAGRFDLVFSRLGVMFFDDPVAAFTNIRRAIKPAGRLAFFSWRAMDQNPWFMVPFAAAAPHLPPQPAADPNLPGTFAFADQDRVRTILSDAGFSAIEVSRHDPMMRLGGPGQAAEAADFATQIGPVSRALATGDPAARKEAVAALIAALATHDGPEGIVLPASGWIVTARA
jgi:SAM-dependent methyltransferase